MLVCEAWVGRYLRNKPMTYLKEGTKEKTYIKRSLHALSSWIKAKEKLSNKGSEDWLYDNAKEDKIGRRRLFLTKNYSFALMILSQNNGRKIVTKKCYYIVYGTPSIKRQTVRMLLHYPWILYRHWNTITFSERKTKNRCFVEKKYISTDQRTSCIKYVCFSWYLI